MMNATHSRTRQRNPEYLWLLCEWVGKVWRHDGDRVVEDRRKALCQARNPALASLDTKEAKVSEKTQARPAVSSGPESHPPLKISHRKLTRYPTLAQIKVLGTHSLQGNL